MPESAQWDLFWKWKKQWSELRASQIWSIVLCCFFDSDPSGMVHPERKWVRIPNRKCGKSNILEALPVCWSTWLHVGVSLSDSVVLFNAILENFSQLNVWHFLKPQRDAFIVSVNTAAEHGLKIQLIGLMYIDFSFSLDFPLFLHNETWINGAIWSTLCLSFFIPTLFCYI